jgi:hypothetical protein
MAPAPAAAPGPLGRRLRADQTPAAGPGQQPLAYWQARSLELAQPNNPQIPLLYKTVARERDFYGFLAADRAQTPYQLNNKPLLLSHN